MWTIPRFTFCRTFSPRCLRFFPASSFTSAATKWTSARGTTIRKRKRACSELGLKDENELQSWFVRQMDQFLAAHNRRLVGWDEILEGGLAPGATVMSWRGIDGGIAAAKAGHDVVMTPESSTYLDHYQWIAPRFEPLGIGGFLPLENIYNFEPVPPTLTPARSAACSRRTSAALVGIYSAVEADGISGLSAS